MSGFSYDRYNRQQRRRANPGFNRTTLGYWLPLAITVTIASMGIATWIWNERRDGDSQDYADDQGTIRPRKAGYRRSRSGEANKHPQEQLVSSAKVSGDEAHEEDSTRQEHGVILEDNEQESTLVARVNDIVRRTPTPQQIYDAASRGVAVVGNRLGMVGREPKEDFRDHERWEGEAESRAGNTEYAAAHHGAVSVPTRVSKPREQQPQVKGKRRMVAVVVSSISSDSNEEVGAHHVSILSQLPRSMDPSKTQLIVLIYAPHLRVHPLSSSARKPLTMPLNPSQSNNPYTPTSFAREEPQRDDDNDSNPPNTAYSDLHLIASTLVSDPTHILLFTTPTGYVHLLRHLHPSLVYVDESLCGTLQEGEIVKQIDGWVGHVVVVVGMEHRGLVDNNGYSRGRAEGRHKEGWGESERGTWWMNEKRAGLGKEVEIVEAVNVGADWEDRVSG